MEQYVIQWQINCLVNLKEIRWQRIRFEPNTHFLSPGKIDLEEFNSTEMVKIKEYFEERLQDSQKRRNATSKTAWLWHDGDELLRYQRDVLQGFHNRWVCSSYRNKELMWEHVPSTLFLWFVAWRYADTNFWRKKLERLVIS